MIISIILIAAVEAGILAICVRNAHRKGHQS